MQPTPATTAPRTTSRIVLTDVTKRYDDRQVLDRVTCTLRPGERVGVIGDNGSGKSTLLRLLAGVEQPDNGTVDVTAPGGIGHLPQTIDLPDTACVGDAIDLALADLRALERRIARAEASLGRATPEELTAYGELVTAYEVRGGRDAERRVEIVLARLGGRTAPDRDRPLGTLSGGQRSRLALAATLAGSPELLLLDEPTNDLDDEAVAWLEEHLLAHPGTVVAVTHDRAFLDRVTTSILEVDGARHTVQRYGNGYAGFLAAKTAARARLHRRYEQWRAENARYSALADSNIGLLSAIPRKAPASFSGAGAFRARSRSHGAMSRIRNAREHLHRLAENPVPPPPQPLRFTGRIQGPTDAPTGTAPDPEAAAQVTAAQLTGVQPSGVQPTGIQLTGIHVPGRLTLDALHLAPGDRLLVTGPNGAGKSTLLQVLAGELVPERGTVRRPDRVGLLRQNTARPEGAEAACTVLETFAATRGCADPEEAADELLAFGLFRARDLAMPVGALSIGGRRRLELAALIANPVDLLLLDEPTNHLAPALAEEIEAALAQYTGTLVVVTHDRRMRAAFARVSRLRLAHQQQLESPSSGPLGIIGG
ncbi:MULTISPECIES: ABC-F family ATP-binding cassette domain-containing protein [unclassified Streptomyces]|uniref:ABC-F family ATP-binding cassette domain-containing protein n=1 Tax=unclassified Streptomyces TaxID=2593676 RepID=UPI0009388F87|nr:ABC-F family ATP-binding cassette domain-containing protein [Streptomyces sp. TSRI0281]OKI32690.1 tylosin resistance protein TlrC [Streptomyces sp. TSRI0281]